jgi:ferredoxin-NADP reductase/MOSC domain-containing protein YiiM/ferredoxin
MSGRLLSVNVGGPRDVSWQGKTVRTAIWKEPVAGPRMVRRNNIDGDDQGDRVAHGGEHRAVFVYQLDSYHYWERELGRDDFTFGQFGENFTVDGLADDEVCIGDRFRIGEAELEVTQPRVTCYRVGIRMDNPQMPTLLVAHHRSGFYLRVLQEGLVEAGDDIVKIADGAEQLTVSEIDALLYLPHRSREALSRAVTIPALSRGWRESFESLLEQPAQAPVAPPAWQGFVPMRVAAKQPESATITSVWLVPLDVPLDGTPVPPSLPGQYLTLRLRVGKDGPPVIRNYSMSRPPDPRRGYRISVKREAHGVASGFLHDHVQVGDLVDVGAPRGSFVLREGTRPVVLLSAGVGVTPLLAMLHAMATAGDRRATWWVHGARNALEHAFAREVDELLARLPDAHRVVAYSQAQPGSPTDGAFDVQGRLTSSAMEHAGVPMDADFYLCGPDAFLREMGSTLTARGVPREQVASEVFGSLGGYASGIVSTGDRPPPHPPGGPPGSGPAVAFSRSSLAVSWAARYPSLLDLAEACDVPVSFGCRNGTCHTCESSLLAGAVEYTSTPLDPPPAGRVLVCCSTPSADIVLDL